MVRKLGAEMVGTFILVFFAVGVATLMFGFKFDGGSAAAGVVATALCFGLVLMSLAYVLGPISGCHVNPAVTLGAVVAGRMEPLEGIFYWIAQFIGGILGALVLWAMFSASPLYSRSRIGLGADGYGSASAIHINAWGAFLAEVILTALFVFAVIGVTSKIANPATAGLVIGLTLTVCHLIGIQITGTSVNPARSLGPALIVGGLALHQVWLFIVAPLVGGLVGAMLHRMLFPADVAERAAA
ncbi:MAG: aquaporin [Acidimicrobiales bacterium]